MSISKEISCLIIGEQTYLASSIIHALKVAHVATDHLSNNLSNLNSNSSANDLQETYPYIIICSAFDGPQGLFNITQNLDFIFPLLEKNTKLLMLLPRFIFSAHEKEAIIIRDKIGHLFKLLGQYSRKVPITVKTLLISDLLNDPFIHSTTSIISYIYHKKSLPSFNKNVDFFYPTDLQSIIHEALKLIFSNNPEWELLSLRGPQSVTLEHLTNILSIKLSSSSFSTVVFRIDLRTLFFQSSIDKIIGEGVSSVNNAVYTSHGHTLTEEKHKSMPLKYKKIKSSLKIDLSSNNFTKIFLQKKRKIIKDKPKRYKFNTVVTILGLSIIVFLILSPISHWALANKYSTADIVKSQKFNDLITLNNGLYSINQNISLILQHLPFALTLSNILSQRSFDWFQMTNFKVKLVQTNYQLSDLLTSSLATKPFDINSDLDKITTQYRDLYNRYQLFEENILYRLTNSNDPQSFKDYSEKILKTTQIMSSLEQIINSGTTINGIVLLQNNLELRPTGGFLAGVVEFTLEKGSLIHYQIYDIYDLDRQLNGIVDPPKTVNQYLGEDQWYFRDSNWDPDFYYSAEQAKWFFEKETNRTVDLVLGINLYSLQHILESLGDVTLSDGRRISSGNILDQAMHHQEIGLDDSGGVKQELLGLLIKDIINKLQTTDQQTKIDFSHQILQSMLNKQLTIASFDTNIERSLITSGISGTVDIPSCPVSQEGECIIDHFYMNEANIGINKANYSIERSHLHKVNITETNVELTHLIDLVNNSISNDWPSGTYKVYIRLYLPKSSQNIKLYKDDQSYSNNDYQELLVRGTKIIATRLDLPIQSKVTLKLSYDLFKEKDQGNFSYAFLMQKQPGTGTSDLLVEINKSEDFKINRSLGDLEKSGDMIRSDRPFNSDKYILVELVKLL